MSIEEIAVLSLQVKELVNRMKRVEAHLNLSENEVTVSTAQDKHLASPSNPSFDRTSEAVAARKVSTPQRTVPPVHSEVRGYRVQKQGTEPGSGAGNLLGIVASICFVLAGIFIVKLAIDQGWLTPVRQIGLSTLFSISLIATGMTLNKRDSEYASFLPASGIILLYVTSFGAHYFYGLIDSFGAGAGACATSFLSLWLFTRFKNEFYTVLAAVGCYLLPLILPEFQTNFFLLSVYFLFFTFSFSLVSAYIESRIFPLVSAYLGIGVLAACAIESNNYLNWNTAIFVQLIQFVFFATGAVFYSIKNRSPLDEGQAWAYFPLLLFFYGAEYILIAKVTPGLAPWVSFGFAGFLFVLFQMSKKFIRRDQLQSGAMITAFCSVVLFHSGYLVLLPEEVKPILLFLVLFGAPLLLARRTQEKPVTLLPEIKIPVLCVMLICAIEYGRIFLGLVSNQEPLFIWKGLVCAVGIIWASRHIRLGDISYLLLVTAHIQSILALYRLVSDSGSVAVSSAWGVYALAVLGVSFAIRDKAIGQSSAIVLGIAAAKVLLYDASSAAPGIRIICLIMTGVLLYLGGFLFRRIAAWEIQI